MSSAEPQVGFGASFPVRFVGVWVGLWPGLLICSEGREPGRENLLPGIPGAEGNSKDEQASSLVWGLG